MGAEIGRVSIEIKARTDEVKRRDRIVLDWYLYAARREPHI
jgi:hypothetical protein